MRQKTRGIIRYGNQRAGVPAIEIIRKKDVELIRDDAREACHLLNRIEFQIKLKPPIKVGILNGCVERDNTSERCCNHYAWTEFSIDE